jgi:hypothetical protein
MGRFVRRGAAAGNPVTDEAVRATIGRFRRQLRDELIVVEALVRMGEMEAAAHAIEDQRIALGNLRVQLQAVVSEFTERGHSVQSYPKGSRLRAIRASLEADEGRDARLRSRS